MLRRCSHTIEYDEKAVLLSTTPKLHIWSYQISRHLIVPKYSGGSPDLTAALYLVN
jgi:hypothetical protein